jgi:CopG family transcriptional regulator, nickel-responsive regulator
MRTSRTTRFSVSLPDTLMGTLDRLASRRGYANRSEFIRDLLRAELVKKEWEDEERGETIGVLALVYDHEVRALTDKLTGIQHQRFRTVTAALHVHLDEHACLEIIVLRGTPRQVRDIANQLITVKGVRYGQLVPATTGQRLS